jgi:phosphatidylglycerol:prolipoprotein diacylglycerol transferase
MGFLLWLSNRFSEKLKHGDIFLSYLVTYPVYRFFMEYLRLDNSYVGGINANQAMMIVIAVLAGGFIFWRHRGEIFSSNKRNLEEKSAEDVE